MTTANTELTVLVVGGAGGMGRHAVRTLARLGAATRILVADLNENRARLVADEIGSGAEAVHLDATDPDAMRTAFADCDVVLNTMGPFARFGTPILRAALDAGCDYLDIDDDWQSTVEALEFDERARAEGRHVVIGLGASPGTTNMCARLAVDRLDTVDDLFTGWSLASAVVEPEDNFPANGAAAAAEHWLLQCTGTIRAWEDGGPADIAPLDRVEFDFPGVGPAYAYTMGHPEAVTLPRAVPGLRYSVNLQCGPAELFDQLRTIVDKVESGTLNIAQAADLIDTRPDIAPVPETSTLPDLFALARGTRSGRSVTVAVYPKLELPGRMGGHTGIPLAIGVELLRRGAMTAPGVHAPETAFAPADFFEVYGSLTLERATNPDDVIAIVETVE
ncbi:saccharopine dehydrogenase family protein [Rhodococcus sp. O3]|uniref:saccharopine dehydrogenase family protein n=1 Tax=Rhodococcus sp. O3 TaxID=3404919 RepID=UPI003B685A86